MKTHLCYIVLWMLSLFMLWGFFEIENARMRWEVLHQASLEPYELRMQVKKLNKSNNQCWIELARMKD